MLHWTKKCMLLCCLSLFLGGYCNYQPAQAAPPKKLFAVKNDLAETINIFWMSPVLGMYPQVREIPPGHTEASLFPEKTIPGDTIVMSMLDDDVSVSRFAKKIPDTDANEVMNASQLIQDQNAVSEEELCNMIKSIAPGGAGGIDCDSNEE